MKIIYILICLIVSYTTSAQCDNYDKHQSPKIANYDIKVRLDHEAKIAYGVQTIQWHNPSPDTIRELRLYMYANSFKDLNSSYLKGGSTKIFGQDLEQRTTGEWGFITMNSIRSAGEDLTDRQQYIQPDDGNSDDQSLVSIPLSDPIAPQESIVLDIEFTIKMPKTVVRTGYGRNDFFLFVHWFPQMCVYEQDKNEVWGWNSHQFMRGTEFFADFGDYTVEIDASDHLVIGASGCRVAHTLEAGRQYVTFVAHDVIDFGWVAYPQYDVYHYAHDGVEIEILMVPEHCAFVDRYLEAVQHGLDYLQQYIGPYPYPKITVVDPPMHTLNSGFMEYPMMITCATAYGIPRSVRSVESLVIHEFTHMYFMATLASNEKEEAWLDEGFVTYYEDRILDYYHGPQSSLIDIWGIRTGNAQQSRDEYVSLQDPRVEIIAKPGYEFKGPFKPIIYGKTATVLKTLEHIVGRQVMDDIVQEYYRQFQFDHPKEKDLRAVIEQVLENYPDISFDVQRYLDQALHTTATIDFHVEDVVHLANKSVVTVGRSGALQIPVDLDIYYDDGSTDIIHLSGDEEQSTIIGKEGVKISKVYIDPDHKIYLDLNFINNSWTSNKDIKPMIKYAATTSHWTQTLGHWLSFLF